MLNVEFDDLSEGLQNVIVAGSNILGKDPVAVHEQLKQHYDERIIIGSKEIANALGISQRSFSRYIKDKPSLKSIIKRNKEINKYVASKSDLDKWIKCN